MVNRTIKRFYRRAEAIATADGAWGVALDGRALRTPAKAEMVLPTRELAAAVAAEWAAQEDRITPHTMPLMQLAATGIDRVAPQRDAVIDALAGFAGTDLLCYRAEGPETLVREQAQQWQPLLDWAAARWGARLEVTAGVMPRPQPAAALAALHAAVAALDDFHLAALHSATTVSGSLVVGLALIHGRLDSRTAFTVSQLDESYQLRHWGDDHEAGLRRARLEAELIAAGRFVELLAV